MSPGSNPINTVLFNFAKFLRENKTFLNVYAKNCHFKPKLCFMEEIPGQGMFDHEQQVLIGQIFLHLKHQISFEFVLA
jgi:hypothetical protein